MECEQCNEYLNKIEELEFDNEELKDRITDLESKIIQAIHTLQGM